MVYLFESFELDEDSFCLMQAGERVPLEPKSLRVLLLLLQSGGKLVEKDKILSSVWKDTFVEETTLTRAIALIRKQLDDDPRRPQFIETVPTLGYRFIAKVETRASGDTPKTALPEESEEVEGVALPDEVPVAEEPRSVWVRMKELRGWTLAGGAVLFVCLLAAVLYLGRPFWSRIASLGTPAPRVLRLAVSLPASQAFVDSVEELRITPDGKAIVYSGRAPHLNQLYYRRLDQLEGAALPGTEDSCCAAISPSGDWVAFGTNHPNVISKVSVHGGVPIVVGKATYLGGLTFGPDDSIYSAEGADGLFRYPADGGPKQRIAVPDPKKNESSWYEPVVLPDKKSVLVHSYITPRGNALVKVNIADGETTVLQGQADNPVGVAGGYLVFGRMDGALGVVPFDADRTRSVEAMIPVQDAPLYRNSGVQASLSSAGDLVYVKATGHSRMVFLDAQGSTTGANTEEHDFASSGPRISPNDKQIVIREQTENVSRGDLWLYDLASGTRRPLTTGINARTPEWTPDGRRVLFSLRPDNGPAEAWWIAADRSSPPERLVAMPVPIIQAVLSPDSRYLVITTSTSSTPALAHGNDLYLVDLKGDRRPQVLEKSSFNEWSPKVSPDGRWLAYVSDESGHSEVYVRPFPGGGAHVQVSAGGGADPRWEKDSRGIVYHDADRFMKARLDIGSSVTVAQRDVLFTGPYTGYDLSPNGSIVALRPGSADAEVIVVTNWIAELKEKLAKK